MPRARGRLPRANNRVPYNMRQRNRVEGNDQPPIQQQQPEQPVIQPVAQPIAIQPEQPQVQQMQHPDVQQNVQQPHNGELLNLNANVNNAPLMIPMSNELDIFVSQNIREKVWNFQCIDLSLLSKSNFSVPNETQNCIAVEEGKLVVQTTSKPQKHKRIETIEMWTDAFLNYVQIIIDRHPQMTKDLLIYMVTIRGATLDATFDRVYMYDQQFRLRVAQDPARSWSHIDGEIYIW